MEILEHIPFNLDLEVLQKKLNVTRTQDLEQFQTLFEDAKSLIHAKAIYRVCYIQEKLEDSVSVDGIRFNSLVLRKNLDPVQRVFPYVLTIGSDLEKKAHLCDDLLAQYYLDVIGNHALVKSLKYIKDHLQAKFALEGISFMSPGSLEDWPIEEQRPLFSLLKTVEASIGVRLNDSLLMIPRKSVSGIYFPTETTFVSCQLCPRENCEGRRARYSEDLAREYGILKMA